MFCLPDQHSPSALVLLVGLLTFFGWVRVGRLVCPALPTPWGTPVAAIVGVLLTAVGVEVAGMAGIATPRVIGGGWWALAACGVVETRAQVMRLEWRVVAGWSGSLPGVLVIAANLTTLLIALAPSAKHDELYYHMLIARRLLTDGELRFYRYPWEGAVLPQMHFQFASAVVHAVGVADAANVTAWCLLVQLQLFVGRVAAVGGRMPTGLATVLGASAGFGTMAIDFHVAAGAHAFGYLAAAVLVVAAAPISGSAVGLTVSGTRRFWVVSWLALGVAASKVTMVPLAVLCLGVCVLHQWPGRTVAMRWLGIGLLPWLVVYTPLAVFTAAHSGSPFGAVAVGILGFSAYSPEEVREIFEMTLRVNEVGTRAFLVTTLVSHSPLTWLGILICLSAVGAPRSVRIYAAILTALQFGLIWTLVQNDVRFLGGYQYGLLALSGALASDRARQFAQRRWIVPTLAIIGLVPWLTGMVYYATATPFAQTSLGLGSREAFASQYTALRADYLELDRRLPVSATFVTPGLRLHNATACRPVVLDPRDAPPGRQLYVLILDRECPELGPWRLGSLVYENPDAVVQVYRRPGVPPSRARLQVYELCPASD